jgi:hypothetical protein
MKSSNRYALFALLCFTYNSLNATVNEKKDGSSSMLSQLKYFIKNINFSRFLHLRKSWKECLQTKEIYTGLLGKICAIFI